MNEKSERTPVSFDSGGVELVGYLYHAAAGNADGDATCVAMGHGFGGTQDRLFVGAERFAGAGFAVLTFISSEKTPSETSEKSGRCLRSSLTDR